jgi:hypothetical protein
MKKRFAFLALSLVMFGMAAADFSTGVISVKAEANKYSRDASGEKPCITLGNGERMKAEYHKCDGDAGFCKEGRWIPKAC